jgi:hypothetical protein
MRLAAARGALRDAVAAVESTGKPVKVEEEIWHGHPLALLVRASHAAEMICVGSIGRRRMVDRLPSTAAGLVASAHCPVAVVPGRTGTESRGPGAVVVHGDDSPADATVIARGIEEARLRNAPLHVVTTWRGTGADGGPRAQAQLNRRLECWRRSNPDVQITAVAFHGPLLNYVTSQPDPVQLVVARAGAFIRPRELFEPNGYAKLHTTACSMLVVGSRHL